MALPRGQFENRTYSWQDTATGKTVIGRNKAAQAMAGAFSIKCDDAEMLKDLLISASEKAGRLKPKSWITTGTFSATGERLQKVSSDPEKAQDILSRARLKEAGLGGTSTQHIVPVDLAHDALAVRPDLRKNGWTLKGMAEHCRLTGYQEGLPRLRLFDAIAQFQAWEKEAVASGRVAKATAHNHRVRLAYVSAYFGDCDFQSLMLTENQQAFVEGPGPLSGHPLVQRPWKRPQKVSACDAISAFAKWGSDPSLRPGRVVYATKSQAKSVWYPPDDDARRKGESSGERYYRNAKTATPSEYRTWIDSSWETDFATRIVLETFLGLRPAEVCNPGKPLEDKPASYYDFATGIFHVSPCCKTGERLVEAPPNAQLMLEVLRQEGRYRIHPYHNLTLWHGRIGYDCSQARKPGFRDRYPARFHRRLNQEGQITLMPWGEWTAKLPRHTCGSIFYAATGGDCGRTAGYLGNQNSTFLKHYKGKVHAMIYGNSVYRACRAFYQTLPKQLRAQGLRERDIALPSWFVLAEDTHRAALRCELVETASRVAIERRSLGC